MSQQRLAFLVAATGVGLAVVSGASPASAATAQPSAATKSAAHSSTSVSTKSLPGKSFPCRLPKGKYLNVSWSKKASYWPGVTAYRFYYNNHCNEYRYIAAYFTAKGHKPYPVTITAKPHGKGDKSQNMRNFWKLSVAAA
ncbi:MAG: hypothetical protein JWN52_1975 [Actinomycetia bacterium]|nr:hypothetical protein [Actinomycetes bacterium]